MPDEEKLQISSSIFKVIWQVAQSMILTQRSEETMTQAKNGDTVKVHYTGKLDDGTAFDSSVNKDPLQFKIGDGRIIPGFEEAVIGMNPGEKKLPPLHQTRLMVHTVRTWYVP